MMTPDQVKTVVRVYQHLLANEGRGWDGLDDYIDYLEYLDDNQLCKEANVVLEYHRDRSVNCPQDHPVEKCFAPILVEAAESILELHRETGNLHEKNKYILQYYLAFNQAGLILLNEPKKSKGQE